MNLTTICTVEREINVRVVASQLGENNTGSELFSHITPRNDDNTAQTGLAGQHENI